MQRALPPEITDIFIDYLRGNPWALCACGLTCHSWLPRSRYNLFHTLVVRNLTSLESLVALAREPRTLPFFDALHELVLYERDMLPPPDPQSYPHRPIEGFSVKQRRSFVHLVPLKLPRVVSAVQVLHVEGLDWHTQPMHPSAPVAFAMFRTVTALTLRHVDFGSFWELQRVLCALPALVELVMHNVRWANDGAPRAVSRRRGQPQLIKLCLHNCRMKEGNALLDWALLTLSSTSLRELQLKDPALDAAVIARAATSFGPALHTLLLDLSGFTPELLRLRDLMPLFEQCTLLRSLSIVSYRNDTLDDLAGSLSSLASGALCTVELKIVTTVDTAEKLQEQLRWLRGVDEVLMHQRFEHLDGVIVSWRLRRFEFEDTILAVLPDLFLRMRKRGILHFTVSVSRLRVIYQC